MLNSTNLPLEKRKIIKKTLEQYTLFILFTICGGLIILLNILLTESSDEIFWLPFLGVSLPVISIILVYIYQVLYYKSYFYDFQDNNATIKKGVVSQSTGYVRYERIQNVYVDQDVLDRIFGLFDVHYETAGETSNTYSHVDGLSQENSKILIKFLNNKIREVNNAKPNNQEIFNSTEHVILNDQKKINKEKTIIDRSNIPISQKIIYSLLKIVPLVLLLIIRISFTIEKNYRISFETSIFMLIGSIFFISLGTYIYYKIWFKNFYFQFLNTSGVIKSRVLTLSSSYIYYDRIQNVNITQGILEKIFNIYSITIETAAENANHNKRFGLKIPGLSNQNAEKLKDFLLTKINIHKNRL